jgi:hypothetical protein
LILKVSIPSGFETSPHDKYLLAPNLEHSKNLNKAASGLHEPVFSLIAHLDLTHIDHIFTSLTASIEGIFGTMAVSEAKSKVERASGLTIFQPNGEFPFTRLPFEMQKEVFQYLLVAGDDEVIRPEIPHGRKNPSCYEHQRPIYCYVRQDHHRSTSPLALECYHKTFETQLLTVSHNINVVAVQVLYGCNRFHVRIVISCAGAA